ncbi:MAG: hypothetical protein ACP5MX_04075 [Candidatus Micrarchaeia archaeon]
MASCISKLQSTCSKYTYESYKAFLKSLKPAEISRQGEGLDDTYKVQLKYRLPPRSMLNYVIAMMP